MLNSTNPKASNDNDATCGAQSQAATKQRRSSRCLLSRVVCEKTLKLKEFKDMQRVLIKNSTEYAVFKSFGFLSKVFGLSWKLKGLLMECGKMRRANGRQRGTEQLPLLQRFFPAACRCSVFLVKCQEGTLHVWLPVNSYDQSWDVEHP